MNINGIEITRGLIIDEPWIGKILSGEKTWEMRSKPTKIRGYIGLIKKGSGRVVGVANLNHSYKNPLPDDVLIDTKCLHQVDYLNNPELKKWNIAWWLSEVSKIEPVEYAHKQGAVIWVKL